MIKHIMDVDINYINYGNKSKDNVVLLHGWGQNIEMMKPLGDGIEDQFNITIIDLPGFGQSSEPTYVWEVKDYAECIYKLLKSLKIENPILIGHSFGGKVSLMYASMYKTKKMILFGSPFCKEIEEIKMKTKILKNLKKVPILNKLEGFAKKHIGSTDYKNASETMRKILVSTVNLDIKEDIKKIKTPTLLIWGTADQEVSIQRARELEKLMKDAGLVEFEGCSHYAYLENLPRTIKIMRNFLGVD